MPGHDPTPKLPGGVWRAGGGCRNRGAIAGFANPKQVGIGWEKEEGVMEKAGEGGKHPTAGGIISEKASYVPGGKGICGSAALDNPQRWFFPSHLGSRGGAAGIWVGVRRPSMPGAPLPSSSWTQLAAPSPPCRRPRARASSGSMDPTGRRHWKISTSWAPSWDGTGRGERAGRGWEGQEPSRGWERVLDGAGMGLEGRGMEGGRRDGGRQRDGGMWERVRNTEGMGLGGWRDLGWGMKGNGG